jgi:hypothetical protein
VSTSAPQQAHAVAAHRATAAAPSPAPPIESQSVPEVSPGILREPVVPPAAPEPLRAAVRPWFWVILLVAIAAGIAAFFVLG